MIDENTIDKLVERLIRRTEQANTYFLKQMGEYIKQIRELKPTQAQQLVQILKYDGTYDEIIKELSKYSKLNVSEIDNIFNDYASKDQMFYEKFYKYKDIPFIPYSENKAVQMQTMALSNIVKNELYDFTRHNVLGYTIHDLDGNVTFLGLKETYNTLLDTALLNVGQGKETFDSSMSRIINDIGNSGLKTLNYESGRNIRLDSAVRMHLKSRLRELHNENQKIYGSEFGSDGIEISVHSNPAVDHEKVQGHQFSNSEYEKLQDGLIAKDINGKIFSLDHDSKNGYRPISEMNCYHYIFSIILGVSEPEYTEKQLQKIIDDNDKGFEFEGKHYTNYEGTQLQRKIETEIRKQKDIKTLAFASDNKEVLDNANLKITYLNDKYKALNEISGLKPKLKRLR